jgi:hypothetical protein
MLLHQRTAITLGADRGPRRLGWEAFDGEGVRRGKILRNLSCCASRIIDACQMSMMARSRVLSVVIGAIASRAKMANSFPFLTGLCEKERIAACSFELLSGTHK